MTILNVGEIQRRALKSLSTYVGLAIEGCRDGRLDIMLTRMCNRAVARMQLELWQSVPGPRESGYNLMSTLATVRTLHDQCNVWLVKSLPSIQTRFEPRLRYMLSDACAWWRHLYTVLNYSVSAIETEVEANLTTFEVSTFRNTLFTALPDAANLTIDTVPFPIDPDVLESSVSDIATSVFWYLFYLNTHTTSFRNPDRVFSVGWLLDPDIKCPRFERLQPHFLRGIEFMYTNDLRVHSIRYVDHIFCAPSNVIEVPELTHELGIDEDMPLKTSERPPVTVPNHFFL